MWPTGGRRSAVSPAAQDAVDGGGLCLQLVETGVRRVGVAEQGVEQGRAGRTRAAIGGEMGSPGGWFSVSVFHSCLGNP